MLFRSITLCLIGFSLHSFAGDLADSGEGEPDRDIVMADVDFNEPDNDTNQKLELNKEIPWGNVACSDVLFKLRNGVKPK